MADDVSRSDIDRMMKRIEEAKDRYPHLYAGLNKHYPEGGYDPAGAPLEVPEEEGEDEN
jgi:hypothetical protein